MKLFIIVGLTLTLTQTLTLTLTQNPNHNPNHNPNTNSNPNPNPKPNPNLTLTLTLTKTQKLNPNLLSYWECCRIMVRKKRFAAGRRHSWQHAGVVHLSLQADGKVAFEDIPRFGIYILYRPHFRVFFIKHTHYLLVTQRYTQLLIAFNVICTRPFIIVCFRRKKKSRVKHHW